MFNPKEKQESNCYRVLLREGAEIASSTRRNYFQRDQGLNAAGVGFG